MALGSWSVDATVDGQPAGRLSFDVTETTVEGTPNKMPLAQPELYARLGQLFVPLRRTALRDRSSNRRPHSSDHKDGFTPRR